MVGKKLERWFEYRMRMGEVREYQEEGWGLPAGGGGWTNVALRVKGERVPRWEWLEHLIAMRAPGCGGYSTCLRGMANIVPYGGV